MPVPSPILIERLSSDIVRLSQLQTNALGEAVFFAMTTDEENAYQQRRIGLQELVREFEFVASLRAQVTKKRKKLRGTVQKVIKPIHPKDPEKAQIDIEEADHLYREIRVENVLTDEKGEKAFLKPGTKVDIVVEADTDATRKAE